MKHSEKNAREYTRLQRETKDAKITAIVWYVIFIAVIAIDIASDIWITPITILVASLVVILFNRFEILRNK